MAKILTQAHPGIGPLIHRQQGVLSARQATAHGLAHETLRQRVLRGIWQRLLPGVYALQCGPPTWRQWLIASLVYAGEGSMLTGPAALAEHGLPPPEIRTGISRIDVLVPHQTRRQSVPGAEPPSRSGEANEHGHGTSRVPDPPAAPGLRIVRVIRPPTPLESDTLRLAPPARAVVDTCLAAAQCAAGAGRASVATTVEHALATGRVSLADLEAELATAPRRHSGPLRAHLAQQREQTRATAVNQLCAALDALTRHAHGRPLRDVAVFSGHSEVARAAVLWPTRAVAAAVDAPEYELASLRRLGFAVVQVTPQNITGDLPGVLRRIDGALRERPEATLPAGVSMLADAQRVLTASSPARTGRSRVLPPPGGAAQT